MVRINCTLFHEGDCSHPCAKEHGKTCVKVTGDPRTTDCALQTYFYKPSAPPAPPPKGR